jgi:hypothetical protein
MLAHARKLRHTISVILRRASNSVSPPPLRSVVGLHGTQNPIIWSYTDDGKHIRWKGDNQSARNCDPSDNLLGLRPKTSMTPVNVLAAPDDDESSPPPLSRSICVIFVITTPDWSIIIHDVNNPNKIASTNRPRMFKSCVGRSRHVMCCVLMCPCRPIQSKNLIPTSDKE